VIDGRKIALLDEIGMNWDKPKPVKSRNADYTMMKINIWSGIGVQIYGR
jgi:hypothetical protein